MTLLALVRIDSIGALFDIIISYDFNTGGGPLTVHIDPATEFVPKIILEKITSAVIADIALHNNVTLSPRDVILLFDAQFGR